MNTEHPRSGAQPGKESTSSASDGPPGTSAPHEAANAQSLASEAVARRDVNILLAFVLGLQELHNVALGSDDAAKVNEIEERWRTPPISLPPVTVEPRERQDVKPALSSTMVSQMRGGRSYHFRIDLAGALSHWNPRDWTECVRDDDGKMLTPPEVRTKFDALLLSGVRFIPIGSCDNFDPEHGCSGHLATIPPPIPPVNVVGVPGLGEPRKPSIGFGEGKKIYDQGWNDGIDQFLRTFNALAGRR